MYNLDTLSCVHRLCAHDNSVTSVQFDERFIVTGGNDGTVKLWDMRTGALVRELLDRPADAVWRVTIRDDRVVVLCRRGERTCMELRTFRPVE